MSYINERTFLTGHLLLDPEATRNLLSSRSSLQALFVMSLSAGARPKRAPKPAYDPDFLYDLPSHSLFSEALEVEDDADNIPKTKQRKQKSFKSKSPTVPDPSPPATSSVDSGNTLTFEQQIQLVQLQKDKLELELQVLTLSSRERPQENTRGGFADDVTEPTSQRRPKRPIDWPHDFVPSVQGEYEKLNLAEFVAGFLVMIKTYESQLKEAFLVHLELLMIKSISYSWSSVRAFHKFVAKQVEQRRLEWQDSKAINDQATTFFRHSDLRSSSSQHEIAQVSQPNSWHSGNSTPSNQQAGKPGLKACRAWNYTGTCDCDKQDSAAYSEHHRCRVCKADHPMLHCPKRRTPIPAQ